MTKEQAQEMAKWLKELNASGYAGCNRKGSIVDRREEPDAIPVMENSMFGVVKPKMLENEPHPEYFTNHF